MYGRWVVVFVRFGLYLVEFRFFFFDLYVFEIDDYCRVFEGE